MPETALLVVALAVVGAAVLWPLRSGSVEPTTMDDDRDAADLRHRAALEALRDVEADRRAGSLDDDAYALERAEAEERAAATRGAAEVPPVAVDPPSHGRGRRAAVLLAATIGLVVVGASLLPNSGVANSTVRNEALAEAQLREAERQARIGELLDALAEDEENPETLSDLADLYLSGTTRDDLSVAATLLRGLIDLEPDRADAYERIIGAYLRAGDHGNARAALDAYEVRPTADPAEIAFYDGIIALRGENDPAAAVDAFDRFLELAPGDPRAAMIEGLRDEAAAAED